MTTYTKILYHVVFGSKRRLNFFNTENQDLLFNYLAGISGNKNCYPYKIGGDKNHVHLIIEVHKTISLSNYVQVMKTVSNKWIRNSNKFPEFPGWQVGFSGFTYDLSALKTLVEYVEGQNEHHRDVTFEEEYLALLEEHGIEYDEKYIWE